MKAGCFPDRAPPLLVVIPFANADSALAFDLLRWIAQLGRCDNECLLVVANHVPEKVRKNALGEALKGFRSASLISPPRPLPDESWPRGANWLFKTAIDWIAHNRKCAFWWNEPDCIPLKRHWLQFLEQEYATCGRPFMGSVIPAVEIDGRKYVDHINGCAVYPADTAQRFAGIEWDSPEAWDVATGRLTAPNAHHTELYHYFWGEPGLPPTFKLFRQKTDARNVFTLENIRKPAVVFHRNKDGTLLALLRKQLPEKREKIIHVVERHASNEPRMKRAILSWAALYASGIVVPCHAWQYERSAKDLGDHRDMPFLKDLLKAGIEMAEDEDIILFTNGDIMLHPALPDLLHERMKASDVQASFRLNISKPVALNFKPESLVSFGRSDHGRDVFAFRCRWLKQHWDDIPDFVVGEFEWDVVMSIIAREANGMRVNSSRDLSVYFKNTEIPLGYVFHEIHAPAWVNPANAQAPAKLHNLQLAKEWYARTGHQHLDTI